MAATLERQIYEAIRGKCVSDASAERAAALAAELAVEKFTPTNSAMVPLLCEINAYFACDPSTRYYREPGIIKRINAVLAQQHQ
jgi:hypothetical protein